MPEPVFKPHLDKSLSCPLPAFLFLHSCIKERKFNILYCARLLEEVKSLENEAYCAVSYNGKIVAFEVADILPIKGISARRRFIKTSEDIHGSGFS